MHQLNIEYLVTFINDNEVIFDIQAGDGVWWTFKYVRVAGSSNPLIGKWKLAPEAGAVGAGPTRGDTRLGVDYCR